MIVNTQVSLLNLTLDTDIPGDVMWSLIDCKHIVSVPHHVRLFVDRVDDCLEERRILFDGREDNPVKENGGAEVDIIMSRHKCGF